MRARGRGKILVTGSLARLVGAADASALAIDAFAHALAEGLRGTSVAVTCLASSDVPTTEKLTVGRVAQIAFDAMNDDDAAQRAA